MEFFSIEDLDAFRHMPGRPPSGVRSNRKVLVPGLDRRQMCALANYVSHLPGVRTAKGKEAQRKEHAILRHRFNRGTLRFGEELNDPQLRKGEAKREARNHKLLKVSAIQHLSYQQVGHRTKSCRQTSGPGSTGHGMPSHRELDIASSSAEIHLLTQENAMEEKLFTPLREYQLDALQLLRCYDATPKIHHFGVLQPILAPLARYFYKEHKSDKKWKVCGYDEHFKKTGRPVPMKGRLEIFAQRVRVSAIRRDGRAQSHNVIVRPQALENGKSSTLYSAVDRGVNGLSTADFITYSPFTKVFFYGECPDGCYANRRKRNKTYTELLPVRNIFSWPLPPCTAHTFNNILRKACKENESIGDPHAVAYTIGESGRHVVLIGALRRHVNEILNHNTQDLPDPSWRRHTESVLKVTVGRPMLKRGRNDNYGVYTSKTRKKAKGADRSEADIDTALFFLNGNCKRARLDHYERACGLCKTREEAVDHITSAIASSGVFPKSTCTIPEKRRFGTMLDSIAEQAAGRMLFQNFLGPVFKLAFGHKPDLAVAATVEKQGIEEEDYSPGSRSYIRGKAARSTFCLNNSQQTIRNAALAFMTPKLSWLFHRMQYLDENGGVVSMFRAETSPFVIVQKEIAGMVRGSLDQLKPLFQHYEDNREVCIQLLDYCHKFMLEVGALLWFHFQRVLEQFPFLAVYWLDPARRKNFVKAFFKQFTCCDEPHCAAKMRAFFEDEATLLRALDEWFGVVLSNCFDNLRLDNMHVERLLSGLSAVESKDQKPTTERAQADGTLVQLLQEHLRAGGTDPRRETSAEIEKEGIVMRKTFNKDGESRDSRVNKHGDSRDSRGGAPPWLLWARNCRARVDGQSYRDWLRASARAFQQEDATVKAVWQGRARAIRKAGSVERASRASHTRPETSSRIRDKSALWGLASDRYPLHPQEFEAAVTQACDGASVPVFKRWGGASREQFQAGCLVKDEGLIPEDAVYRFRLSCAEAHPGLCRSKHRKIYGKCMRGGKQFLDIILQHNLLHSHVKLSLLTDEGDVDSREQDLFLWIGHIRLADPKIALIAKLEVFDKSGFEDHLLLQPAVRHGRLVYGTHQSILVHIVTRHSKLLRIHKVETASLLAKSQPGEDAASFENMIPGQRMQVVATPVCDIDLMEGKKVQKSTDAEPGTTAKLPDDVQFMFEQIKKGFFPAKAAKEGTVASKGHLMPKLDGKALEDSSDDEAKATKCGASSSSTPAAVPKEPEPLPKSDSSTKPPAKAHAKTSGGGDDSDSSGTPSSIHGEGDASSSSTSSSDSSSTSSSSSCDEQTVKAATTVRSSWPCLMQVFADGGELLGEIVWSEKFQKFSAHCLWCRKDGEPWGIHGQCRLDRTISPEARSEWRGRPLTFLLAWLHRAPLCGDREQHYNASLDKPKMIGDFQEPAITRDERLGILKQYGKLLAFDKAMSLQRPLREDEPLEHVRNA